MTCRNLKRDIFVAQLSRWEFFTIVDAEISNIFFFFSPELGAVIDLVSKHRNRTKEYKVNVRPLPECSCIDF